VKKASAFRPASIWERKPVVETTVLRDVIMGLWWTGPTWPSP
jgi:hypothetical protein